MMTPEQLKGRIRNFAKEKNIHAQEVLQSYMFERFLERLSKSKYKNHFVIKGGLLISAMIGISERTTMDLDITIKSFQVDEQRVTDMINEIITTDVEDNINFEFVRIKPIRTDDNYHNYSVAMNALFGKINVPLKIDLTTGDEIVPKEINFKYKMLFEEKDIEILSYTLETILAEKFETILSRGISNTRARDFYDIFILFQLKESEIRWDVLRKAVAKTFKKRNSEQVLLEYEDIIEEIRKSTYLLNIWKNYQAENLYVQRIDFSSILKIISKIGQRVTKIKLR
jgi:predicted nucleotidyltransferase component of viral defense system